MEVINKITPKRLSKDQKRVFNSTINTIKQQINDLSVFQNDEGSASTVYDENTVYIDDGNSTS